ncbi:MAG: PIN domain-containing protein [Pseudomonadota bacterium]
MTDRIFLDTNVLVYTYDTHNGAKQRVAENILRMSIENENAVISVQVLGEFFNVITRKISSPMAPVEALEIIRTLEILPVQEIDRAMVTRAIDTYQRYSISYWDSLIVAAAERSQCARILSEDLNDGQQYYGITVQNPFKISSLQPK